MRSLSFILTIGLFCSTFLAHAKDIQTGGKICAQPEKTCSSTAYEFQPNELSFHLPEKLEWQSAHYSAHFYAVILRSVKAVEMSDPNGDEECKGFISETNRLAVQQQFPENKVFSSRNGCFPMVYYSNVNDKYNFIAVYGGKNESEAGAILAQAKVAGFPDANLRKMQVIVDNGH